MLDNTSLFDHKKIESALVSKTFFEVFEALEESGYNPVNQITGYLVTGDAGYITNYKRAREKIMNIEKVKKYYIANRLVFNCGLLAILFFVNCFVPKFSYLAFFWY